MDQTTRVNLVRSLSKTEKKEIPVSVAADLTGINRTSIYYSGRPISDVELESKAVIDHLHTDHPTWGARQMSAQLKLRGYHIGRIRLGQLTHVYSNQARIPVSEVQTFSWTT